MIKTAFSKTKIKILNKQIKKPTPKALLDIEL
jgi:hypothetical protein